MHRPLCHAKHPTTPGGYFLNWTVLCSLKSSPLCPSLKHSVQYKSPSHPLHLTTASALQITHHGSSLGSAGSWLENSGASGDNLSSSFTSARICARTLSSESESLDSDLSSEFSSLSFLFEGLTLSLSSCSCIARSFLSSLRAALASS